MEKNIAREKEVLGEKRSQKRLMSEETGSL
jgi:hypothetical protein